MSSKFGLKWDRRFLDVADMVSSWSKDPSTKVGAILVRHDRKIVSTGYNGLPHDIVDSDEILNDRETKYKYVIHAERNAIDNTTYDPSGCIMYVTVPCCEACANYIADNGIETVVWVENEEFSRRWNTDKAIEVFHRKNVNVIILSEENNG